MGPNPSMQGWAGVAWGARAWSQCVKLIPAYRASQGLMWLYRAQSPEPNPGMRGLIQPVNWPLPSGWAKRLSTIILSCCSDQGIVLSRAICFFPFVFNIKHKMLLFTFKVPVYLSTPISFCWLSSNPFPPLVEQVGDGDLSSWTNFQTSAFMLSPMLSCTPGRSSS